MGSTLLRLLPLIGATALSACISWTPFQPREVAARDPDAAFTSMVRAIRRAYYQPIEVVPATRYARLASRSSDDSYEANITSGFGSISSGPLTPRKITHLHFQVDRAGVLRVWALGYHAREGEIDQRVAAEIDGLIGKIVGEDDFPRASAPPGH